MAFVAFVLAFSAINDSLGVHERIILTLEQRGAGAAARSAAREQAACTKMGREPALEWGYRADFRPWPPIA